MPWDEDAPLTSGLGSHRILEGLRHSARSGSGGYRARFREVQGTPAKIQDGQCPGVLHARGSACRRGGARRAKSQGGTRKDSPPPFALEEILRFLNRNAEAVEIASRKARRARPAGSGGRPGLNGGITSRNCLAGARQTSRQPGRIGDTPDRSGRKADRFSHSRLFRRTPGRDPGTS